jgi:hypothetical protein
MKCPKCDHYDKWIPFKVADENALKEVYGYGSTCDPVNITCEECEHEFKVKVVRTIEYVIEEEEEEL